MKNKRWLTAYEEGVPHEIDEERYSSVDEYLQECCDRFRDAPAISNFGSLLTYSQVVEKSEVFAGYLQQNLGLEKGDRIAIMLPNILQYPIAMFAALKAGLVVVNINPACTGRELAIQLQDSGATSIVIFEACAYKLEKTADKSHLKHIIITNIGDAFSWPKSDLSNFTLRFIKNKIPDWTLVETISFNDALTKGKPFQKLSLSQSDIAFLQYTGGTTGVPKGAILSHGNILANIQQTYLWTKNHFDESEERVIVALPMYHIFALTINFLSSFKFGAVHLLVTDPRNIDGFVTELKRSGFTALFGVNTLFAKLLASDKFRQLDFSGLKCTIGGGDAVQSSTAEDWRKVVGHPIFQAYGLTEASPGVCCNPLNLKLFNGTVGVPVPSTLVEIRDDTGNAIDINTPGELFVKGPQVMQGYWHKAEETKNTLSKGWLQTGDIATMDDQGYITIVDRKKDLIIVSGFKVYPNEIENVLVSHPAISDAAVIGEPSSVTGEVVKAYIVTNDALLQEAEIQCFCRDNLSAYKVPSHIQFVDDIPKTNVGKVLRRQLRKTAT